MMLGLRWDRTNLSTHAGTPTARMSDFVSTRLLTSLPAPLSPLAVSATPVLVTPLPFTLDRKALTMIGEAEKEFTKHVDAYELFYCSFERYGKEGIKKMGVSPDAWSVVSSFLLHDRITDSVNGAAGPK